MTASYTPENLVHTTGIFIVLDSLPFDCVALLGLEKDMPTGC